MWYIGPAGTAHTVCDDGSRVAVRRFPDPRRSPEWIILVDGVRKEKLGTHETLDAAMKQAELWLFSQDQEA